MPKRITVYLIVTITLASLLMVLGCGSGDKGATPRLDVAELLSAGTDTTGGGTGGGATGACVVTGFYCVEGIDQTTCSSFSGVFNVGQTCAANGYTSCSIAGGYTVCI